MYCSSGDITRVPPYRWPDGRDREFYGVVARRRHRRRFPVVPSFPRPSPTRVLASVTKRPKWYENPPFQPRNCKDCINHLPRGVGLWPPRVTLRRSHGGPGDTAQLGEVAHVGVRRDDPHGEAVAAGPLAGE